jgi:hypothetical protein
LVVPKICVVALAGRVDPAASASERITVEAVAGHLIRKPPEQPPGSREPTRGKMRWFERSGSDRTEKT